MPIHQTKLMMSNAHPTGMLLPQMPMPVSNSFAMVTLSTIRSTNETRKPNNQPICVRFVRTVWLIVSVTDSNVWPGAMTGGVRPSRAATSPLMAARGEGSIGAAI